MQTHGQMQVLEPGLADTPERRGAAARIGLRGIQRLQRRGGGLRSARQIAGHCGADTAKEQYERSLRREHSTIKLLCLASTTIKRNITRIWGRRT